MSEAHDSRLNHSAERVSPDDALPPVEPPSFGFLAQLFFIPALIVGILLAVWLAINWLANLGNDPQRYVRALERDNEYRWQAAFNLAGALRSTRDDSVRHDAAMASGLAALLDREVEKARLTESDLKLRVFLAHALGEFQVPDVLPSLIKTLQTRRDESESIVQRAAAEAVAVWLSNQPEVVARPPAELTAALLVAAADPNDKLLRSTTAFTLGILGGETARNQLASMLSDTWPDTRFNAAVALARSGDRRAIDVVEVMLDPEESASLSTETDQASQDFKQRLILVNGLQAAGMLADQRADANLAPLKSQVEHLLQQAVLDTELRILAQETLAKLEQATVDPQ